MARTIAGGWVVANRRTAGLLLGDLIVIGVLVGLGELRHGGELVDWAVTYGEFTVAWLVVATPLGAYGETAIRSMRRSGGLTFISWTIAATLGVAIRALVETFATFSFVFLLVMLGTGLIFLLPWRAIVAPWILTG